MAKYHIDINGKSVLCTAKVQECPRQADGHYDTPEAAQEAYNKKMTAEYGETVTVRVKPRVKVDPRDSLESYKPFMLENLSKETQMAVREAKEAGDTQALAQHTRTFEKIRDESKTRLAEMAAFEQKKIEAPSVYTQQESIHIASNKQLKDYSLEEVHDMKNKVVEYSKTVEDDENAYEDAIYAEDRLKGELSFRRDRLQNIAKRSEFEIERTQQL